MGKSTGKRKAKKKKKATPNKSPLISPKPLEVKENFSIGLIFKKTWKFLVALSVIITLIVAYPSIRDYFSTPKEQYDKETFVQGDLKPKPLTNYPIESHPIFFLSPIKDNYPIIKGILMKGFSKRHDIGVRFSTNIFKENTEDFYNGFDFFRENHFQPFMPCESPRLIFGVKDDRLYVSVEFKDLEKEELIGSIEFNHWKLYKPNLLDFNSTDEKLEVRDKQNNIVFSVKYETDSTNAYIDISGYLITPTSVVVLTNNPAERISHQCFSKDEKNWKQNASKEIAKLKSIF